MKLAWANDLHLGFAELRNPTNFKEFFQILEFCDADALVLCGDTSHADELESHLSQMYLSFRKPIYFILGNHDFYGSSISEMRDKAASWGWNSCSVGGPMPPIYYLPASVPQLLGDGVALIGHDGWGDCRNGKFDPGFWLSDFEVIDELAGLSDRSRVAALQKLGTEAAMFLEEAVAQALEEADTVIVATHAPPFVEAAWHIYAPSDPEALPHFTCQAVGRVLRWAMESNPDKRMLVLCGHTHTAREVFVLPNLKVIAGGAKYGHPALQKTLDTHNLFGE